MKEHYIQRLQENYDLPLVDFPYTFTIENLEVQNVSLLLSRIDEKYMDIYFSSEIVPKKYEYCCSHMDWDNDTVAEEKLWVLDSQDRSQNNPPLLMGGKVCGNLYKIPTSYLPDGSLSKMTRAFNKKPLYPDEFKEELKLVENCNELKDIILNYSFNVEEKMESPSSSSKFRPIRSGDILEISYYSEKVKKYPFKKEYDCGATVTFLEKNRLAELNDKLYDMYEKRYIPEFPDEDYDEGFDESVKKHKRRLYY